MTSLEPVQLVGGTGSPYTQKMVALLRYRRIPLRHNLGPTRDKVRGTGRRGTQTDLYAHLLF